MSNFFFRVSLSLLALFVIGCGSTKLKSSKDLQINFLSEYIVPDNLIMDNTLIGGLSGIDYYNGHYYLVCDDSNNPRVYEAKIVIDDDKISNITFEKVISIDDSSKYLDLESIRYDSDLDQILLTSEGHILRQKDPLFFSINPSGQIQNTFQIPVAFKSNSIQKPRHNATLEGLCMASDKKGFWLGMELPLEADGPEPQYTPTKSPIRITYISSKTKSPEKQFAYFLEPVAKKSLGNFSVNGLTDLVQYNANTFLILERSYSSGLGNEGNTIKIFEANVSDVTNTIKMNSLKDFDFIAAKKKLLLNFENLRDKLTDNSIDNIEGITLGPKLSNGHQSLILVSDNNFNILGKQFNQFILLELIEN
ncbi:esterase-like activity of phytase family protein [Gaetbulibacter aquiaggeris]|uniref:Esterase-like activity of phytase family protein n=1 Tax=Gaetbulibacter aquiaggeris TaxID=1735373 RepID=A0ABW7MP02_9FLAO